MTVQNTINKQQFACNGSVTEFPFGFQIFSENDIIVILTDPAGANSVLNYLTDYDVIAAPGGWFHGGTVQTSAVYPVNSKLTIVRKLDLVQTLDLGFNDRLPSVELEKALDRIVMILQDHEEALERTVKLPVTSNDDPENYLELAQNSAAAALNAQWSSETARNQAMTARTAAELARDQALAADPHAAASAAIADNMLTADTTVNFDSSMTASQIQALIHAVPKNLNGHILTFHFADGSYTLDAALWFQSFYGGEVYIVGNGGDSSTSGAAKSVILNFSSARGMSIISCQARMSIMYIEVNISNAADDVIAVVCGDSNYIRIYYSNVNGNRIAGQGYNRGIYYGACAGAIIVNTGIKNCGTAIYMDFSSATEFGATGEGNLYFTQLYQSALLSNNIKDGGRHCSGGIIIHSNGTINGHSPDRVGNIERAPKLTMDGALPLYGGSINKSDYPILTTWVYANGFAKTMDQFLANNNLRTFFIEHPTDSNIIFLPDWKGLYERGLDQSGSFDPDGAARTLMDYQADEFKSHVHDIAARVGISSGADTSTIMSGSEFATAATGGNETRGKNVAVNYFIYYC